MPSFKAVAFSALTLLLGMCASAVAAASTAPRVENSVVKIFSTLRYPDPLKPWSRLAPSDITGSGVVIEGNRILTDARNVLYAGQIQIQANEAGDRISAEVIVIAPGIGLAVLKLDDESFFRTHRALAWAKELPQIKDSVLTYGYPAGGAELSITKGIVSRIEFVPYSYPDSGLRIQIDAALNAGNNGGPVVSGDKMVGMAYVHAGGDTHNIGYIIPNEEVELFLKGIVDGHYQGKPGLHDEWQTLENPALRAYLKLDKATEGIVVNNPDDRLPGNPLHKWDVITKIANFPIDDEGMVKLGADLRVDFQYRVQQVARNGMVQLTVVRAGKTLDLQVPVPTTWPTLIPDAPGNYPPYFIYGPLVLSKATGLLLNTVRKNAAKLMGLAWASNPLITEFNAAPTNEQEELVVISSPFFPDNISRGYDSSLYGVIHAINGQHPRSLQHAVEILRDLTDEYIVIEFANHTETLVFPRQEMEASTERILTDNGVRTRASADMLAVWQAKSDPQ